MTDKSILVDSGATDNFIDPRLIKRLGLGTRRLDRAKKIWNIDGTNNRAGMITDFVDLEVRTGKAEKPMRFLVTDLGLEDMILGYPWLAAFEPKFSWKDAVIDTTSLPIVIRSLDWRSLVIRPTIAHIDNDPIISRIVTETLSDKEKDDIVRELEQENCISANISTQLANDASQYTKTVDIPSEYQRHSRVFSEEEANRFPPSRPWDHAIELKEGAPSAIDCKIYPIPPGEDEALRKFLETEQAKGYIRPSKSPYASSFFFIKKKDGKLRPVQDYRRLNDYTVKNKYPLPLIPELIAQVKDAWIFTKFDIRWGYNNVRIKKGDEHKAAFKTRYGLFEPLVMYFGLTNSPATFQTMMNHIFYPLQSKYRTLGSEIIVYMDDVLIASSASLGHHRSAVHDVLDLFAQHDLFVKPEKCVWESQRVDYLGLILEKGVTRMDPTKIAGISNWPIPTTVKQVRSFLGFCNFYRPFIQHFSHLAKPLNELTRKDVPWQWTSRHQEAFDHLRKRVTSEPVLIQPNLDQPFELEVDASGFALGAVLTQRGKDNKRHPVAYFSTTLTEPERNYDIYDLELLAIVKGLRHWRQYLAGSPHKITVFTDHANLQYWRQPQKISRRIAREVLELSEFDIELKHIPGTNNGRADALSRRPDYDQGENDNDQVTVLPEKLFIRVGSTLSYLPTSSSIQNQETLKPWINRNNLKKLNDEWWKGTRKVVTEVDEQKKIVQAYHDIPTSGHPGISRTTDLVSRYYWWPSLTHDVYKYVRGCAECQRTKANTQHRKATLNPITPALEAVPFQTIALDFIVKLPVSAGYDSILTITDHDCTKAAVFIPCNETITGEGVADLYLRHIFPRFGLPSRVISDRDPRFTSRFMKELCKLLGIEQNISTAYHPRTDGQSERTNQWLEQFLRPWVNAQQNNWHHYLPIAEFAHNSWRNETTRMSPFKMMMGYDPRAEYRDLPSSIPNLVLRADVWKQARKDAHNNIIKAHERWARAKREGRTFKEGDQVWLEGRNLHIDQPSAKLAPKRHGPFTIKRVLSPITYQLTLPNTWKIHDVFHIDLLTQFVETDFHGPNYERPPPDLIDGEAEYEVEKILKSRRFGRGRKLQYLIKWKGYPDSDNEWVNWDDAHAEEAVAEFKRTNPKAETHIRASKTTESSIPPSLTSLIQDVYSMSTDASFVRSTDTSMAQDLAEATARFPSITLGSPDPGSPSPITVPSRTPSPIRELEGPTLIPKRKRVVSAGTNPWAPITVPSRSPSPVSPKKPRPTPDAGLDALIVKSWGSNPGSPIPGTPEYDFDLSRPPSPPGPAPPLPPIRNSSGKLPAKLAAETRGSPMVLDARFLADPLDSDDPPSNDGPRMVKLDPPSSSSACLPKPWHVGCTDKCFDFTYTLHHHDHSTPSDKDNRWTSATLIDDQTLKDKRVWGYALDYKPDSKWEILSGRGEPYEVAPTEVRAIMRQALMSLTECVQRGRCS